MHRSSLTVCVWRIFIIINMLVKVLNRPGHGNYKCCIVANRMFHLSYKRLLQFFRVRPKPKVRFVRPVWAPYTSLDLTRFNQQKQVQLDTIKHKSAARQQLRNQREDAEPSWREHINLDPNVLFIWIHKEEKATGGYKYHSINGPGLQCVGSRSGSGPLRLTGAALLHLQRQRPAHSGPNTDSAASPRGTGDTSHCNNITSGSQRRAIS